MGIKNKLITHADYNDDGDNDIIIINKNGIGSYLENIRGGYFQKMENNTIQVEKQPMIDLASHSSVLEKKITKKRSPRNKYISFEEAKAFAQNLNIK